MQVVRQSASFTIGICATGTSENLIPLLRLIASESYGEDFTLRQIIIIASECARQTLIDVRSFVGTNKLFLLIEEKERRGKADAINKIIARSAGSYVVFVNADALPLSGSIPRLLRSIARSESVGMVSGRALPHPNSRQANGATSKVEELMWAIHNECSSRLNHLNVSNHGSDEMMVVRSSALRGLLPSGVINDGAYIGGVVKSRGYRIEFCSGARVVVDVPEKIPDLLRQRQRIIFGHFQVWQLTGRAPKTVESMLLSLPHTSLEIVVRVLSRHPRLIKVAPITFVCEALSFVLALKDMFSPASSRKHRVWKRYAN